MIYSTKHNKNTNEDPKTSVVFENLMLLPDNVFWGILKSAASNKGILPEDAGLLADDYEFWPKWNPNSKYDTGNSNYVEPDVFFRFGNLDVIVEAKYSDNGGQYREEWERENWTIGLENYASRLKKVKSSLQDMQKNHTKKVIAIILRPKTSFIKISMQLKLLMHRSKWYQSLSTMCVCIT